MNPRSPIAISGLPLLGVSSQTDFRPRRPARRGLFLSETTHVRAPYAQSQRHRASALHAEGRKRPILANECNDCFSRQWNGSARRPGSPNRRAHRRSPPGRRGALDTRLRGSGAAVIGPRVQARAPGSARTPMPAAMAYRPNSWLMVRGSLSQGVRPHRTLCRFINRTSNDRTHGATMQPAPSNWSSRPRPSLL